MLLCPSPRWMCFVLSRTIRYAPYLWIVAAALWFLLDSRPNLPEDNNVLGGQTRTQFYSLADHYPLGDPLVDRSLSGRQYLTNDYFSIDFRVSTNQTSQRKILWFSGQQGLDLDQESLRYALRRPFHIRTRLSRYTDANAPINRIPNLSKGDTMWLVRWLGIAWETLEIPLRFDLEHDEPGHFALSVYPDSGWWSKQPLNWPVKPPPLCLISLDGDHLRFWSPPEADRHPNMGWGGVENRYNPRPGKTYMASDNIWLRLILLLYLVAIPISAFMVVVTGPMFILMVLKPIFVVCGIAMILYLAYGLRNGRPSLHLDLGHLWTSENQVPGGSNEADKEVVEDLEAQKPKEPLPLDAHVPIELQ